ncbi:hypothetical protein EDB85DRAFT_1023796 [Lactarius pseudohatsudake]|nr:hypothetical protein EDB85DRAFT_1023796 [Lactarius pseudohatsudake]
MVLFLFQYCRVIVHSFGHKAEANDTAPQTKRSAYVDTCMEAAFALLDLWLDYMHSTGHVRYAPDFFFVGTGFAGAFLLERARVIDACEAVVKKLHAAAVDDSHVPYSYAVFLENALQKAAPEPPIPAPAPAYPDSLSGIPRHVALSCLVLMTHVTLRCKGNSYLMWDCMYFFFTYPHVCLRLH